MTNIAIIGIIYIINLDMFIWYFNQKEQAVLIKLMYEKITII
jgi:hypothetical protein